MSQENDQSQATAKRGGIGRYVVVIIALAFVGLLAFGLATGGDERVEAGAVAPDFQLTYFDGSSVQLSDLRGQVVVVNFWATWCLSCKDEADDLEKTWRAYQDQNIQFIGVDYLDQEPKNLEWIEYYDITYPNGPDIQGRVYNAYGVQGLPETFVIDQNGTIAHVYVGGLTYAELSSVIDRILAEGPA